MYTHKPRKKNTEDTDEIDKIAFSIVLHMITCLLNVNLYGVVVS